ncbi:unnamed protein product [Spirodela intermedia]|uniref:Uncharacterized protein n=1 Tax=Spirodela intermedia TaxID=51605 RepID=A0A7I8IH87_SPIIN|nr:unnamed protein product [Spirodela intermedia]CAA6656664.1 unnamed protein product [Spirodela intermedia]
MGGATHNFLCTKIIDNLSLQMEKLNSYNIVMGNDNTVVGATICKAIPLHYSHFIALYHPFSAKEVTQLFIKEIVRLYEFLKTMVSDTGRIFLTAFWCERHTL